jgi:hypothetical protein
MATKPAHLPFALFTLFTTFASTGVLFSFLLDMDSSYVVMEAARLDDTYIPFKVSRYPHDDIFAAGLGRPFISAIPVWRDLMTFDKSQDYRDLCRRLCAYVYSVHSKDGRLKGNFIR